ncbi:hypothetical protein BGW38_007731, partial [Lunasporangiospora selenospora]
MSVGELVGAVEVRAGVVEFGERVGGGGLSLDREEDELDELLDEEDEDEDEDDDDDEEDDEE